MCDRELIIVMVEWLFRCYCSLMTKKEINMGKHKHVSQKLQEDEVEITEHQEGKN